MKRKLTLFLIVVIIAVIIIELDEELYLHNYSKSGNVNTENCILLQNRSSIIGFPYNLKPELLLINLENGKMKRISGIYSPIKCFTDYVLSENCISFRVSDWDGEAPSDKITIFTENGKYNLKEEEEVCYSYTIMDDNLIGGTEEGIFVRSIKEGTKRYVIKYDELYSAPEILVSGDYIIGYYDEQMKGYNLKTDVAFNIKNDLAIEGIGLKDDKLYCLLVDDKESINKNEGQIVELNLKTGEKRTIVVIDVNRDIVFYKALPIKVTEKYLYLYDYKANIIRVDINTGKIKIVVDLQEYHNYTDCSFVIEDMRTYYCKNYMATEFMYYTNGNWRRKLLVYDYDGNFQFERKLGLL